jgi:hypothetical protein
MDRKTQLKMTMTSGLVLLAVGGLLLHLRIHSPTQDEDNFVPFLSGIVSIFIVPWMFWFRRTAAYAYVINGFLVILGTITMAHFSIVHFKGPLTLPSILLNTTLADIALLWGKFAVGKNLFDLQFLHADTDAVPGGRFFRYPNMGWWWVHLVGLSAVYALGNIFWQ